MRVAGPLFFVTLTFQLHARHQFVTCIGYYVISLQKEIYNMNQKFIKSAFLGSLVAGTLIFGNFKANATGFHEGNNNSGIAITTSKFTEMLAKTNLDHLGYNFGMPDEIQTLKDTAGDRVGSVWVYHNAVQKDGSKQDVSFIIINGKLQYATLSSASKDLAFYTHK